MEIQYTTLTSGTVTVNNTNQDVQVIHDAGATVTLTIAFPANPFNGQILGIASTGGVTTLTLSAAVGTILNAITTLAGGGASRYQYLAATSKWYKI